LHFNNDEVTVPFVGIERPADNDIYYSGSAEVVRKQESHIIVIPYEVTLYNEGMDCFVPTHRDSQ